MDGDGDSGAERVVKHKRFSLPVGLNVMRRNRAPTASSSRAIGPTYHSFAFVPESFRQWTFRRTPPKIQIWPHAKTAKIFSECGQLYPQAQKKGLETRGQGCPRTFCCRPSARRSVRQDSSAYHPILFHPRRHLCGEGVGDVEPVRVLPQHTLRYAGPQPRAGFQIEKTGVKRQVIPRTAPVDPHPCVNRRIEVIPPITGVARHAGNKSDRIRPELALVT